MEKATISQVKNRLSAYLRKVRAGETVLILDRDQPVAVIEGVRDIERSDERLARLESKGLIRRATQAIDTESLRNEPIEGGETVLEALLEERREGR